MFQKYFFTSMTRISDLESRPFEVRVLPQDQWETGDYVVGEVISPSGNHLVVELPTGRMTEVMEGDLVVGAFGVRRATLEAVGDWQSIGDDGVMQAMTEGGLFGRVTSESFLADPMASMTYQGHVFRDEKKVCMQDFVPDISETNYQCPTVMVVGTSMSCGKTTSIRSIIAQLKRSGLKVVGVKFAGAGQYHDILSMQDAGADAIFDFVDVGLPSTVCPEDEFRVSVHKLLAKIAAEKPDVVVAEAGASPLEPYNGSVVLDVIKDQICFTVICASDPYSVLALITSFGLHPDLVSGIATSDSAGVELVEKLTGVKALSLPQRKSLQQLQELLQEKLDF
jgi:hypothetical protein